MSITEEKVTEAPVRLGEATEDTEVLDGSTLLSGAPPPTTTGKLIGSVLNYLELRKTPHGILPVAIFSLLGFTIAVQGQVVNFAAPNIAQDLHFTVAELIDIAVAVQLSTIVASIAFAYFLDRSRRAHWVGIGSLVAAITLLLQSRASSLQSFAVPASVGQVGGAAANTPGYSMIADYYPPEARGRVFALRDVAENVGIAGASVFGGLLIVRYGWRSMNALLAVPIVIASVLAFLVLREPVRGYFEKRAAGFDDAGARQREASLSMEESFRAVFAVRTLRRIFWAELVGYLGLGAFSLFQILLLADYYGLDANGRALVLLPSVLGSLVGGYLGGGTIDLLSRRSPASILRVAGVVGVFGAATNFVVAAALPLPVFIVSSTLAAFAVGALSPVRRALTSQVVPPSVRTLGITLLDIGRIPGTLALVYYAQIQNAYGYSAALTVASVFLLLGALIYLSAADFFDVDRRQAIMAGAAAQEWEIEHQAWLREHGSTAPGENGR